MIEFIPRGARHSPGIVCDACREQIVGRGNFLRAVKVRDSKDETPEQSPLYATHKGACDVALEQWLMAQYDSQWIPLWEEIGDFLQQLAQSWARDTSTTRKGSYERALIRHPASGPHATLP